MSVPAAAPPPGRLRQQRRERGCAGRRRPGGAARPRASPPPASPLSRSPCRLGRSLKPIQAGQRRRPPPVTSAGEDLIGRRKCSATGLLFSEAAGFTRYPNALSCSRRLALKRPQLFPRHNFATAEQGRAGQGRPSPLGKPPPQGGLSCRGSRVPQPPARHRSALARRPRWPRAAAAGAPGKAVPGRGGAGRAGPQRTSSWPNPSRSKRDGTSPTTAPLRPPPPAPCRAAVRWPGARPEPARADWPARHRPAEGWGVGRGPLCAATCRRPRREAGRGGASARLGEGIRRSLAAAGAWRGAG